MSKKSLFKEIIQWIEAIVIAIVIAVLIRGLIFEPVIIDGSSMNNTLTDKDRVILSKINLTFNDIEIGDIVVLEIEAPNFKVLTFLNNYEWTKRLLPTASGTDYIKRVVAIGGDIIDIRNGYVYVNDIKLIEDYVKEDRATKAKFVEYPYTIPDGELFVLGDNRLHSTDSREFGSIGEDKILGTVSYRIWPISSFGKLQ